MKLNWDFDEKMNVEIWVFCAFFSIFFLLLSSIRIGVFRGRYCGVGGGRADEEVDLGVLCFEF